MSKRFISSRLMEVFCWLHRKGEQTAKKKVNSTRFMLVGAETDAKQHNGEGSYAATTVKTWVLSGSTHFHTNGFYIAGNAAAIKGLSQQVLETHYTHPVT